MPKILIDALENQIVKDKHLKIKRKLEFEKQILFEAYQHHGWRENDVCGTLTAGQNDGVRGDTPLIVGINYDE